ncbi:Filamentous hemagglutinin [Burkholderia diffusa]|uniref:hemagglutinin repeat-containing protein n=1 Tax=Burkholderia diffusa TaxID=488732 RepID=UPI001CB6053C|nr:hemagglutinin repeat-containing protein [Burkholderia diffusa]CAG9241907.1 Filamentous hemagglutinin [Burkholderia diffusa]
MNKNQYRLVFSRIRGMLIAVEETASSSGKANGGETVRAACGGLRRAVTQFALRHAAFAALIVSGVVPTWVNAQVVGAGANAPSVIQTQNGLQQINITKPSGAGVSLNTYSQFDVPRVGVIVNNSPTLTNTQQAGYINGNPNFGANDAARIIINQVNSSNPSQLKGFVEIAGQRAEMIISNPSGLVVDGGGFINTSRAILTTGTPNLNADGSLAGFNVTRGLITVQGAGLNATNVDQIDLISRAVQANAAIYASNLNVVTGANQVNHDTLQATRIQGDGPAPAVAIDVGQLGGMYSNRIFLVGTEGGVGVRNAGTIAADAMGLTLTTDGRLVQSGKISALGNVAVTAGGGIENSGTTYSQQSVSLNTGADVVNTGMLAAQHNVGISAGSLSSTGGIGAGVDSNGTVTQAGDLQVTTTGQLSATGQNIAGGNTTLSGAGVNLAGSKTATNGTLDVTATAGDINLSNATTSAQGALNATAAGTIVNDHGSLSSQSAATLTAGSVSNQGGTVSSQGPLTVKSSGAISNQAGTLVSQNTADVEGGAIDNQQGIIQSAGQMTVAGASLQNTAGRVTSLNGDGLSITTLGQLTNATGTTASGAQGGVIGGGGAVSLNTGDLVNHGAISAQSGLNVVSQSVDNSAGGYIGADSVSIKSQGAVNNQAGAIESNHALTVSADSLANDGGSIKALGTDALSVTATNALTNTANGVIGGNGAVSVAAGSIDDSNGSLLAAQSLTVQSNGQLANSAGLIQANGNVSVAAQGAVLNNGGQIAANGATSTLTLSGASVDNSDGRIANIGTGATTINGGASITNTDASGKAGAGTIGGNGDVTLTAQTLTNAQGGQTLAGHDLTLNVGSNANNGGGVLSAANNLTFNGANAALSNQNGSVHANGVLSLNAASIDDTSGKIGNDAGSGGSVSIQTGALSNQGGAIGSDQDLTLSTGTLSGDGSIVAGRNGSITLGSDYTQTAANRLHANGDLAFTTSGKLTNQGVLDANGALTVNAANVDNQSGADLNSATTTVNANGGTIDNAGRIEGDTVVTNSATLNNTGTVIGANVTSNANTITNTGAAAVFAAANQLNLYATNQLSNTGGANLFSVGDINIAANSQRDANGLLANRTQNVLNDQSTIEAQGNVELAAGTFTNSRPAPTVTTETTGTTTSHQTKRQQYIACATMNADPNGGCSQAMWVNGYKTPLTSSYSPSQVVSESSGPNATDKVLVVNVNGKQQTIYYNTLTTNPDGSVTVNYWDGYDPHVNYVPDTEYTTRSDGHNGYQRVEIARDTTTTTQQDVVTSQAQQAQLVAGGNITMANVGTINNDYSVITAGKSIQIGSTQQNGSVGSGSYGGTTVNNVGQTLYQYQTDKIVSTYAWNEDPTQDVGTIVEPSVVHTPVAIGGTGGTIIANQSVSITGQSVNNQNVAAQNSATGATGGTLGNNGAQQPVSGSLVGAPQSVASATGALSITLPTSGMYSIHPAPGQPYLIVTDPRLTSYTNFISSDYMLGQLNLNPASIEKRLGDGMYEQQMVRNQITQLTGRTFLPGYANAEDEYRALMTNGVNYAKDFGLVPGMALSAAQMDALTSDIVWLVDQTVTLPDGSTTHVLAPVVYMAQTHANDLQPTGALIAADDVEIHTTGTTTNTGVIKGGTKTVLTATDILNRGGTISSSATNGTTVVSATNDVVNASGMITGNRVAVSAGRDIVNTTLVDAVGATGASGASKASTSLIGQQGTIAATGDLSVQAGRDLSLHGANLSAGGDALVTAGRDINVDTVQSTTNQSMYLNDQHHWEESTTKNVTSGINADGNLTVLSGNDATFKGAAVSAGKDLSVVALGNLTATTVTDESRTNNVAVDGRARKEVDHTYDQTAVGTTFSAGHDASLAAVNTADPTKGNVALTGSTVTSGTNSLTPGGVTINASGNVTMDEGREEHDSFRDVQTKRGSFVSGSTTDGMQNMQTNIGVGSTLSGDTVQVHAGKDLTIQGSNVVGTNDVKLDATGNVIIKTSQDTQNAQSYYEKRDYGFLSGLNPLNQLDGGLQGYSIGVRKTTDAQQATSVTNVGSMVGSLNGNLSISSGNDLHVTGSTLHAGNDLKLDGKTVKIDTAQDTGTQSEQQSFSQTGITAGLSGTIVNAVQTGIQMKNDVRHINGDARLGALAAATTGLAAKNAIDQIGQTGNGVGNLGVSVSLGTSHSNSSSTASHNTAVGSTVAAGYNVSITATGAGADSNIDVLGSTVSAGNDALLKADGKINLEAAQNTDSQYSKNSGSSAGIGVTLGVGQQNGLSFQLGVSGNKGNGNGSDTTYTNTHVTAGNTLTVQSGGDTNLIGAVASGKQVVADVGGNLNVQSLQDLSKYDSKQQSAGVSISVCVPPFCYGTSSGSANFSQQKMHSDYAAVSEQSGIKAGDGGFQVNVKGNTDLKGGVIASSDKAVQDGANSLTTATLTASDIENHASYDASQVGLSAGYGSGGFNVSPPVALGASGDASSMTRSGISGGSLTITDSAKQQELTGKTADETIASVNRDTSNTGGALAPIFDKDKIQAGFDITSQFINEVGTFVSNRAAEADAATKAAQDPSLTPEQRAAAQQTADQLNADWGPNGTYRQVLTALSVAAGGNVTGGVGQFAQSATVAYLQQLGTNGVKQIADYLDKDDTGVGESARAALHAIAGCAGAAATSGSCGAGAMGAAASSVLGSLMKPADQLSATEREQRENLVTSLVTAIAAASGQNAATAAGAAQIEVENNQLAPVFGRTVSGSPYVPKGMGGYTGEQRTKDDAAIVDPTTDLGSATPDGKLSSPEGLAKTLHDITTAILPDQWAPLADLVTSVLTAQLHHICTDKNCVSTSNGGPWTPRFQQLFDGADMTLQDQANKVLVDGHVGPHPQEYHDTVFNRLTDAVFGLQPKTPEYANALRNELNAIGKEIQTPGTPLNKMVTKK